MEAKQKKLKETKGRPDHWGGLLYIVGVERRREFRNKSWSEAVHTNRVRMPANIKEHTG